MAYVTASVEQKLRGRLVTLSAIVLLWAGARLDSRTLHTSVGRSLARTFGEGHLAGNLVAKAREAIRLKTAGQPGISS